MKRRGNNEGTVSRRRDGRWEAKFHAGYDAETGNPKRITRYFKTRAEAQDWLAQMQYERNVGLFVEPHKITLKDWVTHWVEVYKKPTVRSKTWDTYSGLVKNHIIPSLGHIPLMQLRTSDLQKFYNEKRRSGLSSRTIHMIHQVISGSLKQALKEQLVKRNAAEAVTLPPLKYQEISPLSAEDVSSFLAAAKGHRLYAAFLLALGTGLRRGELLALRWRDVDFKYGTITVRQSLGREKVEGGITKTALVFNEPKTKKSRRTIAVPQEALKELKAHKAQQNEEKLFFGPAYQDNNLVFCAANGKPLDPDNFARVHAQLLKKAGIPHVSVHTLRHTSATLLLQADEHPKVVQEMLGHTRISTTLDIYSHTNPGLLRRAADKLNDFLVPKEKPSTREDRQ